MLESVEPEVRSAGPVLSATDVVKHYRQGGSARMTRALDGVSVDVWSGRPVGIAGESGSGKSTLLRLLLGLEGPTAGDVSFASRPIRHLSAGERRTYRRSVQAVFQDPSSSLDPRHRIWRSVTEPVWVAEGLSRRQRRSRAAELLTIVGLPGSYANRYPHQLSGGERQRVAIARALSSRPKVVLLDEPVTSLDVSIRAQIMNLLAARAAEMGVTYVVISHDLTAIYYLTDYLYIVYRGLVVEEGPTEEIIANPLHPYTRTLVASVGDPMFDSGMVAEDAEAASGACPYRPRCPMAMERCAVCPPASVGPTAHPVRCWLHDAPVDFLGNTPNREPLSQTQRSEA